MHNLEYPRNKNTMYDIKIDDDVTLDTRIVDLTYNQLFSLLKQVYYQEADNILTKSKKVTSHNMASEPSITQYVNDTLLCVDNIVVNGHKDMLEFELKIGRTSYGSMFQGVVTNNRNNLLKHLKHDSNSYDTSNYFSNYLNKVGYSVLKQVQNGENKVRTKPKIYSGSVCDVLITSSTNSALRLSFESNVRYLDGVSDSEAYYHYPQTITTFLNEILPKFRTKLNSNITKIYKKLEDYNKKQNLKDSNVSSKKCWKQVLEHYGLEKRIQVGTHYSDGRVTSLKITFLKSKSDNAFDLVAQAIAHYVGVPVDEIESIAQVIDL